jgi:hypothetical protein
MTTNGQSPCVTVEEFDRGYVVWRDRRRAHFHAHGQFPPEIWTRMTSANETDSTCTTPRGTEPCEPAPYVHRENYEQPPEYWANTFAKHQILRQDARTLELRDPADSNNWMTIAIDDGGQIVVLGDNTTVVFGYCRTATLAHRISWIGCHVRADTYVTGKARIGSPTQKLYRAYPEAFEADVREYLKGLDESGEYADITTAGQLEWDEFGCSGSALEALEHSSVTAIWELGDYLRDIGCEQEIEDYHALGQRTTGDVERAHAAIRRAWSILCEQGAYEPE